ncbi:hypothetical protein GQ457_10G000170 [Hibiscus cannabinus]
MAARKKESNLGKDKRPVCPSNIPVPGQGSRRHSLGSALPNKSTTKCPISDGFVPTTTKNVQKTAQRPDPLRRSDARPASVQKKSLVSPKPTTTTRSSSFPSKLPSCIPKPTFEKVAKTPIAAKPSTLSSSSKTTTTTTTRNIKAAAPSPRPSIKRGTTTSSALKKPSHDKKQAKKLENKEISDHQAEEVVRGEIHDIQMPKAEEETQQHAQVEEKYMLDDVSTLTHQEMEDKFHEQEHDGSNSSDHSEEAKNNDSEEEINASHDEQENITHEETKIETQDKEAEEGNTTEEEVASTKESEEENSDQGNEQELEEEANLVAEAEAAYGEKETIEEEANLVPASQVEADADATHGKNESVEEVPKSQVQVEAAALPKEETNMVPESQVQKETVVEEKKANSVPVQAEAGNGKNEAPTPNSDVVEVPASKPVIARKGRVRALVGAFESQT